jgi:hypothetical protein
MRRVVIILLLHVPPACARSRSSYGPGMHTRAHPSPPHSLPDPQQARDEEFLQRNLMAGLPPLQQRVQEIRQGNAATNAQDNDKNFVRSQVSGEGAA